MNIPLYRTSRSAGDSVSMVNRKMFKVEPGESVKISEIVKTVENNVDLTALMEAMRRGPDSVSDVSQVRPTGRIRSWFSRLFGSR